MLFFFFLIIDLYFLIPAAFTQIFNSIAELAISMEIPTKEEKTGTETHPVIVEAKIGNLFMPLTNQLALFYFSNKIICFIYIFQSKFLTYVFISHIFKASIYFQLNNLKPRTFNISNSSSSLNNFSSSALHLLQTIEKTNVFSRRYDVLGF